MKITAHSESHIVELDDGTKWQIFPGDLDVTLHWKPETDVKLVRIDDDISPQALISEGDDGRVRGRVHRRRGARVRHGGPGQNVLDQLGQAISHARIHSATWVRCQPLSEAVV